MVQLPLFDTNELLPVREYLHDWNAIERAHRLEEKTRSNGCQEIRRAEKVAHAVLSHSQSVARKS